MGYQLGLIFDEQTKGGSKLGVGIHEGVTVTGIEIGDNFFDINFEKDGLVINKRLWEPNGNYPRKDSKTGAYLETSEQAKERNAKENLAHLGAIVEIFLGKEWMANLPEMDNYNDVVAKVKTALTPKLKTKLVNLKVIYDADGQYPVLGRYVSGLSKYVEEHVPGEAPKIEFTDYELKERTTKKESNKPDNSLTNVL